MSFFYGFEADFDMIAFSSSAFCFNVCEMGKKSNAKLLCVEEKRKFCSVSQLVQKIRIYAFAFFFLSLGLVLMMYATDSHIKKKQHNQYFILFVENHKRRRHKYRKS